MQVIRVLWGDPKGPHSRFGRVWKHGVRPRLYELSKFRQHVYVYGKGGANKLTKAGVRDVHLVDDDPYPRGTDWLRTECRWTKIGRRWLHKLDLVKRALLDHEEVVYCDWDVTCGLSSVAEAVDLLGGGDAHFSLVKYRRKSGVCCGRTGADGSVVVDVPDMNKERKGLTVSGRWMHLRGTDRLDEARRYIEENDWCWHDEWALASTIRWKGEEDWLENYESPLMVQPEKWCPWIKRAEDERTIVRDTPVPFTWHKLFMG